MISTKILSGIAISVVGILIALYFVPTNEFFGINSYNSKSPLPIVVLSNEPEKFEINPINCSSESDMVEFQFNVENKSDENHRLEIYLVLNNINDENLSKEAILVETLAGQTITVNHEVPFNPDFASCQIELERSEKIE